MLNKLEVSKNLLTKDLPVPHRRRPRWPLFLLVLSWVSPPALAADTLTLEKYLEAVRAQNAAYRASMEKREASKRRRAEADLIFAPQLVSSLNLRFDGRLPTLPFLNYERFDTHAFELGVQQQFSFGLKAKLAYQIDYIGYENLIGLPPNLLVKFYDARPVLEVAVPLWQNAFGSSARATQLLQEAQAEAEQHGAEAACRALELKAESVYWQLAIAREIVRQQEQAVGAAEALERYVAKKVSLSLGDRADLLQAKASLESRKLSLQTARDQERVAARAFNALRNAPPTEEPEPLEAIDYEKLVRYEPPTRHGTRADVRVAEAQAKLAQANATSLRERNKPQLDVYASAALNGRDQTLGTLAGAIGNAYNLQRPTWGAGFKFVMPLDFRATADTRRAATQLENAAELELQQKRLDQEQDWADLTARLVDARERYRLATEIERIQQEKLLYERRRLRQGRTTTFQVLQFEQEFTGASLGRASAAAELLQLVSQLKLYEGDPS
jgi:outer membrane protein TolC